MKPILLHACCGPCATHCVETLRAAGYAPTLFFSNSNIAPASEYRARLDAIRKFAALTNMPLVEDSYNPGSWQSLVRGLENEPERGRRCHACFRHNFTRAAQFAAENGFAEFTTTLTVSPHKDSATIFEIGKSVADEIGASLAFAPFNFKKNNGFLNSLRLADEYGLYRQTYCGCAFSVRNEPS